MSNKTSSSPGTLAFTALATLALAGCGVGEAKLDGEALTAATAPLPVQTAPAQIGDLYARYQASANIASDGEAQVPARVDGEVIELLVEEGDAVVQGQILARVDGERLRLRMLQSEAVFRQRSSEYRRQRQLHEQGLVSRAAFESLKFAVDEYSAAHDIDRLNYSYTEIRAPIGGVISARYIRLGQQVSNGDLAFRISDTSRLLATLKLPQRELARFRAGQQASLTVDAYPGIVFDAGIERLSPTIDRQNGSIRATVGIDNRDGKLAPGMFARFELLYEKHAASLAVPAQSIVQEDGETLVYRVADGKAERRVVTVGIVTGDRVQILSGLEAGDQVITSGTGGLKQGTQVLASSSIPKLRGG
jgi:RND family efflux transporter MFP subunit